MKKLLRKLFTFAFTATILTTVSAQEIRPSGPSRPTQSEFFTSLVAMALVSSQEPTSIFALTLDIKKPLPAGSTIQVEFDNPNQADSPFVIENVEVKDGKLLARSPKFEGIRNKKAYLARTKVLGTDQRLLSVHEQWIWFEMPQEMRKLYATKIID